MHLEPIGSLVGNFVDEFGFWNHVSNFWFVLKGEKWTNINLWAFARCAYVKKPKENP